MDPRLAGRNLRPSTESMDSIGCLFWASVEFIWTKAFQAIALAISPRVVPMARRDLISRSIETLGSHRSILAIRDWLDLTSRANSSWVRRLF